MSLWRIIIKPISSVSEMEKEFRRECGDTVDIHYSLPNRDSWTCYADDDDLNPVRPSFFSKITPISPMDKLLALHHGTTGHYYVTLTDEESKLFIKRTVGYRMFYVDRCTDSKAYVSLLENEGDIWDNMDIYVFKRSDTIQEILTEEVDSSLYDRLRNEISAARITLLKYLLQNGCSMSGSHVITIRFMDDETMVSQGEIRDVRVHPSLLEGLQIVHWGTMRGVLQLHIDPSITEDENVIHTLSAFIEWFFNLLMTDKTDRDSIIASLVNMDILYATHVLVDVCRQLQDRYTLPFETIKLLLLEICKVHTPYDPDTDPAICEP
jgi:hypothetical protein